MLGIILKSILDDDVVRMCTGLGWIKLRFNIFVIFILDILLCYINYDY